MGSEIRASIRPAIVFLLLLTIVCGLIYPLLVTGIGQLVFPWRANGSLVMDGGRVVGSELIGQDFAGPTWFHPRPSSAGKGYDASNSSGSNLGPTSDSLKKSIAQRVAAARKDGITGPVPADMVTASGSGLDPDISPENALAQVPRVAAARHLDPASVQALVEKSIIRPSLGLLGTPRINVLRLNRQLNAIGPQARP